MSEPGLRVASAGGIAMLSIDRPAVRNALDAATLDALVAALDEADRDSSLRVVVLRGHDETPFSSGYDLGTVPENAVYDEESARALHAPVRRAAVAIANCRHVVVAAIRGYAMGAALDIASHADLRVAADPSRFALPASRLGFAYPLEAIRRLRCTLGPAATEALLLEGRQFSGDEMLRSGFLHHLWPAETFENALEEFLADFGRRAPLALRGLKRTLRHSCCATDPAAEAETYRTIADCLNSADAREGPAAFRERRDPRFTGG